MLNIRHEASSLGIRGARFHRHLLWETILANYPAAKSSGTRHGEHTRDLALCEGAWLLGPAEEMGFTGAQTREDISGSISARMTTEHVHPHV